ncbi:MAG: hypothetical protein ABS21_04100 [SAR86 cluster bacterium BACL1 MAG-121105-bin34]|nr:MAG: hypothetical protein ABS21_04100 [SAR86 cluster bacterium BACL1 MAG-121105-bin34]
MHLFSRNSIILYSLLGLVSLFLAGFIKDVLEFNTWIEVIIASPLALLFLCTCWLEKSLAGILERNE